MVSPVVIVIIFLEISRSHLGLGQTFIGWDVSCVTTASLVEMVLLKISSFSEFEAG